MIIWKKSIDRVYNIDSFSSDAPENILCEKWLILTPFLDRLKLVNLRTLEKISLFL